MYANKQKKLNLNNASVGGVCTWQVQGTWDGARDMLCCWRNSPELVPVIQNITTKDILDASKWLQKDPVYCQQNMTRLGKSRPEIATELTGRQARVVLYYKIYRFFWGETPAEEERDRKKICQCVEMMVLARHPNDEYDHQALQDRADGGYEYEIHW